MTVPMNWFVGHLALTTAVAAIGCGQLENGTSSEKGHRAVSRRNDRACPTYAPASSATAADALVSMASTLRELTAADTK